MFVARKTARWIAPVLAMALSGCAQLPDLGADRAAAGPAPHLVPLDGILSQADAIGAGQAAIPTVEARAERLRDKAERLRRQ